MKNRTWRKKLLLSKEQHDDECKLLRERNFKSLKEKNEVLRYYCDEVLTNDIKSSLFIILDDDEYRFPKLERSIERGKEYYWILDEFIETSSGLLPRWYLENNSNCS
jgi:hypothetical protein